MRALILLPVLLGLSAADAVTVLTYHNDNARTGQNLVETVLTPANVTSAQFGLLFSYPVDGYVYAQPLYVPGLFIPGKGRHNVVFAATENDSVYAFDADYNVLSNAVPLWHASFINPAQGITPVPSGDVNGGDLVPQIGITSTPVIDPGTGTMYVLARTKEVAGSTAYVQRLHALDITTGTEKFGGPVVIQASVPGSCTPNDGHGNVVFDPKQHNPRTGLLLSNGAVYMAWSSLGDTDPYQGWIMGYDAHTLQPTAVFNTVPDDIDPVNHTCRGGVWQSGAGLATDDAGNIFVMTGNGSFNLNQGGRDTGESMLKLSAAGGTLVIGDYFTPHDVQDLNATDFDLGSGGALLLPDQPGPYPHLIVGAGKSGTIFLVNRDNMGKFNSGSDQVVQSLANALTYLGEFGMPAYFNNTVYFGGQNDVLKAFGLANGTLSATPASQARNGFGRRGATPAVSANGTSNGILWAIQSDASDSNGPAVLHAYDATNLATELYNSSQAGSRDDPGPAVKFTVPTIANGKVYLGTETGLAVFGLLYSGAPAPAIQSVAPSFVTLNRPAVLKVNGANFQPGFSVLLKESAGRTIMLPPSALHFISASQVEVEVTMTGSKPYEGGLTIINPGGLNTTAVFGVVKQGSTPR